jgi:hypothetical protein
MPKAFREEIEAAVQTFAATLLKAFTSLPLNELMAEAASLEEAPAARRGTTAKTASKGAAKKVAVVPERRRGRRRGGVDEALLDKVLGTLRGKAQGLRAEQLRAELGVSKQELAPVVKAALANKQITKKGERRLTTYFAK